MGGGRACMDVCVAPELSYSFILGADGLEGLQVVLDFSQKKRATCRGVVVGFVSTQEVDFGEAKGDDRRRLEELLEEYTDLFGKVVPAAAVLWTIRFFHSYLSGDRFRVLSGHAPLKWFAGRQDATEGLARWRMRLREHPGLQNARHKWSIFLMVQDLFPDMDLLTAQAKAHLLECHSVTKEEEAMVDSFLEPITLTLASDDAGFESSVQFSFESDDPSAPDSLMTEKLELKLDADGPSYECPNCNMAFESLDALDEHKREPDQCRIKCRYCDLMFWSRKERVKHHRVHKENANVSCDSCGKFFISAKGLAIHRRRGGCMEERFSCPICHMEFPTVVSRKNHYSTHTRCPECGVENVKNMIDHFRTVHLRQFTCDHCGRTFKTKLIFEQHLARVHKLNGVTERTYQCSGCGKVFTDYSNMKAHFRQFHSSDKNFECQLCGKRTGSQSLLRKHHERVHLHVAKYRCTCCPKVFVYPSQLKKHSRFHTGEMNFPCIMTRFNKASTLLAVLVYELQHPQYTFEEAVVRNKPFKYLGNGDFTLDEKYQNLLIRQAAASVQPIEELEEDALMSVHPTTTPLEEVTMAEVSGFMGEDGRVSDGCECKFSAGLFLFQGYQRQTYVYKLPEPVRDFIINFYRAYKENDQVALQELYEVGYPALTEDFFKTQPWPIDEDIEDLVDKDSTFLILYRELYFRHIYARVPSALNISERFGSYYNYCGFFNLILSAKDPVTMNLPHQWLWDIIDEFIYQFHSWSRYQCNLSKKSDEELSILRSDRKVWNVHSVINVLHSLVDKSNINQQLRAYAEGENPEAVAGEFGHHSLYKMLGYFSLIGLLRLHTLLSDYHQAVKVLENIQLNKKSVYSRVPACQITTYYYVGFCYLMMRRYADAIRAFSQILLYIQRTRQMFQAKNYQNDQINKQTDQMYNLLAICLVLHPQQIDESVMGVLRERPYSDKIASMQKPELKEFENCFAFACPKFISPVPPHPDLPLDNYDKEPLQLQLRIFSEEVSQQLIIPVIRSYLKLYTTMPIAKISSFLGMEPNEFLRHLLCFKHKMTSLVCTKGKSGLDGEFQAGSEVDFYIDRDTDHDIEMIHIADTKVARRYGDFFIRQIHKFEELNTNLRALAFPAPASMQKPELKEFENCFAFACPKFISPVPPHPDLPLDNYDKEPLQLQLRIFSEEVSQQLIIPVIRSYLKLYTTMPIAKISSFLGMEPNEFLRHLLCFKHKMTSLVCTKGKSGLDGEFQAGSEVDFYIDRDTDHDIEMIHIADTKVARRYGDFFIRQIHKFEELNTNLRALAFPAPAVAAKGM
ncbi:unnamed protein product [Cyprideis torosa]|uniref:Eukaryotic translation initiation factor 3 subunit L n=1 Tax=Cyprideis torosa TaxID=163714 RepID=A0A7R8WE25_9CRUS|nr:unnamed protein product [Cyprideis torosa]CAG0893852.1 unnamed protein product [Cyprideis torosa]